MSQKKVKQKKIIVNLTDQLKISKDLIGTLLKAAKDIIKRFNWGPFKGKMHHDAIEFLGYL